MRWKFICSCVMGIVLILFAIIIGSADIDFLLVCDILSHKIFHTQTSATATQIAILWNIRLPRVLLAFLVGGGLGLSGAVTQSLLQNPLASPYTLGISSGASLGSAIVILFSLQIPLFGTLTQLIAGFLFANLTIFFVMWFSFRLDKSMSKTTIILTGMIASLFINGCMTLFISLSKENIAQLMLWQMGSFTSRGWQYVGILIPFLCLGFLISFCFVKEFDLLTFGEEQAQLVGVSVLKVKIIGFLCITLITGSAIAITGTIGFVDLIAPHMARKLYGVKHIILLPASFFVGGCFMVLADTIARTAFAPSEISIGAITGMVGAPIFFLIYQNKNKIN